jgi:hypothetical protein
MTPNTGVTCLVETCGICGRPRAYMVDGYPNPECRNGCGLSPEDRERYQPLLRAREPRRRITRRNPESSIDRSARSFWELCVVAAAHSQPTSQAIIFADQGLRNWRARFDETSPEYGQQKEPKI